MTSRQEDPNFVNEGMGLLCITMMINSSSGRSSVYGRKLNVSKTTVICAIIYYKGSELSFHKQFIYPNFLLR